MTAMSDVPLSQRTPVEHDEPVLLRDEPIPLGYPESDPRDDRPRLGGHRKRVALGAALLVALVGVAGFGAAGWRVYAQKDATLTMPEAAAGLRRDDSDRARSTAEYLRNGLAADIELDRSVGAVYQDPTDPKRAVLLFGGTTLLWQPERDLDSLFRLMSDATGTVEGLREVAAGDLGGVMKCGRTSGPDGNFAICGWADHGSVVLAMFPDREPADAGALMRKLRTAIQTRN